MTAAIAGDRVAVEPAVRLGLATEIALFAVTASGLLALGRLFVDDDYLAPLLTVTLVAHVTAALVRRSSLRGWAVPAVGIALGLEVVTLVRYPRTTWLLLPSTATWSQATHDLAEGWHEFGRVVAPAPTTSGFVLASAVALWVVAWFSDSAAFRMNAPVEAMLPAGSVLLFGAMLGDSDEWRPATFAFAGAVLAFLLLYRTDRAGRASGWIGGGRREATWSMLVVGTALAVLAVGVGGSLGARAPGASSDELVDWRGNRKQPSTRITVSPLVDIRKRLVQQSDALVFSVASTRRAYWRLTSLDAFDGTVWSSGGSFARVTRNLSGGLAPPRAVAIRQEFQIINLAAIWLPAAYRPTRIDAEGAKVRWDDTSGTLIVDSSVDSSDGLAYSVVSEQPSLTRAMLDRGIGLTPDAIRNHYLHLPAKFPISVRVLAGQITGGGANPYERARLLQDYFRENFVYDLNDTRAGHSDEAIEEFLASGRGYCEQFAGTFAAMARAIGLPSRVAVGFTPGEEDPTEPGRYLVRGRYAHAWPEVWINDVGWVPFEPTPGRGMPGAEGYTGVPEQQADTGGDPSTTTTAPSAPVTTDPRRPQNTEPTSRVDTAAPKPDSVRTRLAPVTRGIGTLAAVAALVAAWVGGIALVRLRRRVQRRRNAVTPGQQVQVAWLEGTEAVAALGAPRSPAETQQEFADRARESIGEAAPPLDRLADLAALAQWSGAATRPETVVEATTLRTEVDREVARQLGRRRRLWRAVDPRMGAPG